MDAPDELGETFDTKAALAAAFAAQWAMIPMTRAMDTLVINISNRSSSLKDVLKAVYEKRRDYIEWVEIDQ